jgi:hypothetical protein
MLVGDNVRGPDFDTLFQGNLRTEVVDVNTKARIPSDCKFAFLALTNARVDIPNAGLTLPDGTEIFTQLPIELDSQWQGWLGIQASQITGANLVLARTAKSGFAPEHLPISDNTNLELAKQIDNIFTMSRLLGTIEYEGAFLIIGHVQQGRPICEISRCSEGNSGSHQAVAELPCSARC